MAFKDLENEELEAVAEFFAVDLPEDLPKTKAARKKALVAALTEGDDPVSEEDYENVYLPQKPKTAEEVAQEKAEAEAEAEAAEAAKVRDVLVKMKAGAGFTMGPSIKFSHTHPFALVTKDEAIYLTSNYHDRFTYATPQEAAEYYA